MQIYADNAATTALSPQVLEAMMPYLTEVFGNPSSLYRIGGAAKDAVEESREKIANLIGAKSGAEIYFTSGGTESDNWAITNAARLGAKKGKKHIISTTFEHHAVLHTLMMLEKEGEILTVNACYEDPDVQIYGFDPELMDEKQAIRVGMYGYTTLSVVTMRDD